MVKHSLIEHKNPRSRVPALVTTHVQEDRRPGEGMKTGEISSCGSWYACIDTVFRVPEEACQLGELLH